MATGLELTRSVIDRFLGDIHTMVDNNFDADRYPEGPASMRPGLVQQSKATFNNLVANADRLAEAQCLFADTESRTLFADLLAYRLAGPLHVKLRTNTADHWRARAQAQETVRRPSDEAIRAQFGALSRCEVAFLGQTISLDCTPLNVAWAFLIKQYFFARDGVRIAPAPGDVAIDGGACAGDTMLAFAAAVGQHGMVHAFDPCAGHLELSRHNLQLNPWARATLHPFGLSDCDQTSAPIPIAGLSPGITVRGAQGQAVPLRKIDTLVAQGAIERIDFIKLDIEGSEMMALRGAREAIRRFRPRLAISLYHRPEDFFEIPFLLRDMDCGYRFYLDHYTIFGEETILYAI
jgi:FkbM family methyltransferase